MNKEKTGYEKQLSDIKEHGLHIIHVLEDEKGPNFSYSVGLFHTYQHPEIIMIGLKRELAHTLINNIAFDINKGKTYEGGQFYSDILDDFDCLILNVEAKYYDEYFGQASKFYESNDFPVVQCVYPTVNGVYPWEDIWPENLKDIQPLLGRINSSIIKK